MAYSSGAIFIRMATVTEGISAPGFILVLCAARLAIASLCLIPGWKGFAQSRYPLKTLRWSILAGIGLAAYLATWMISLSYTSIAVSITLSNTQPIWAIFLAWWWFHDKPRRVALVGTALALTGSVIITWNPASLATHYTLAWIGNSLALIGAICNCVYLVLGHKIQSLGLKVRHHLGVVYTTAALILLPIALASGYGYRVYAPKTYGCILLLALVPQLIGHSCFNLAVQHIKPHALTLVILGEPMIAGLLGYWVFGEAQGVSVIIGAGVLITGVAIATVNVAPKVVSTFSPTDTPFNQTPQSGEMDHRAMAQNQPKQSLVETQ